MCSLARFRPSIRTNVDALVGSYPFVDLEMNVNKQAEPSGVSLLCLPQRTPEKRTGLGTYVRDDLGYATFLFSA